MISDGDFNVIDFNLLSSCGSITWIDHQGQKIYNNQTGSNRNMTSAKIEVKQKSKKKQMRLSRGSQNCKYLQTPISNGNSAEATTSIF